MVISFYRRRAEDQSCPFSEQHRFVSSCFLVSPLALILLNGIRPKNCGTIEQGPVLSQLTLNDAAKLKPLSATLSSPCIVVKTDEGNYAKATGSGLGMSEGASNLRPCC